MSTDTVYFDCIHTPLGHVGIQASDSGITAVAFTEAPSPRLMQNQHTHDAVEQLLEYFSGHRYQFDVKLDLQGTAFQRRVWNILLQIPYGEVWSYGDVAEQLHNPRAVRAVGAANGRNPVAIIVPCHRVIGANGTLTGYAGGLPKKAQLLTLENHQRSFQL